MLNKRQKISLKIKELELINKDIKKLCLLQEDPLFTPGEMTRVLIDEVKEYMDKLGSCKEEDLNELEETINLEIEQSSNLLTEIKKENV